MEVGTWVKWTAEDFSYTGQITKIKDGKITMITNDGEMTVPEGDGKFDTTWKGPAPSKVAKAAQAAKESPKKVAKPAATGTKKEQAIELVRAYVAKHGSVPARSVGIQLLVAELGMTEGGASTYFNEAKKAVA